jgi:predicted nucleotidyltransferase component of viral defense system
MSTPPKKELIEEVAQIKGISEAFIEKDWFVTQVIKLVSEIIFEDYRIVFTGGTSLSKAHGIIQRFSEDIDFRVITPSVELFSKTQQSKILSTFKKEIVRSLRLHFDINDEQISANNGNKFVAIELNYPTYFTLADALRPHILLEFTVSEPLLPAIDLPVSSMINQVAKQIPEIDKIACVNPVENAADKLSAITWRIAERVRGSENDSPDIVRHIHDLAIMKDLALGNPNFSVLVNTALSRDNNRSELIKDLSLSEKLSNVMNIISSDTEYVKEYDRFVNAMSYANNDTIPTFKIALQNVGELVDRVISVNNKTK